MPENEEERPLSWKAVPDHTPIHASGGEDVGMLVQVQGAEAQDIFHGLVVSLGMLQRDVFIPATNVRAMTNRRIDVDLRADQVGELPAYEWERS